MAQAIELKGRRDGDGENASGMLRYLVSGATDQTAAKAAVVAIAPTTLDGKGLLTVEAEELGSDFWQCEAVYGYRRSQKSNLPGYPRYEFSTSGGTQHITQSLETLKAYPSTGEVAYNFGGALCVGRDGEVGGTDIPAPEMRFSIDETRQATDVTFAYVNLVNSLTATVNNAAFSGYAAGEVLYLGATGRQINPNKWEIHHEFAVSRNAINIRIGASIVIPQKYGWDFLWVFYQEREDPSLPAIVTYPVCAYVERVLNYANHNLLGL